MSGETGSEEEARKESEKEGKKSQRDTRDGIDGLMPDIWS